ncbi:MAG: hypothetical protein QOC94_3736 [Actinoplanes sp.]|nr:hypothetical protein [Actinoplanes sp.]
MDFWDLTVVIFRRWKVSLPFFLLAVGATALVAFTVKPDYTMTSYIQFIPAKIAASDDAVNASMRNPWNQLGLDTLGQASIYTTQDQSFLDSLKAGKHTDNFTLTITYPNPIVTVEVVGKTPADARQTTELIISRLRASAQALQEQSGVQRRDIIPTQRLDQGQNVVASGGKVKRALAAVAAAGLLLTAGGAVGFDALARRRARKREELEREERERAASEQDEPERGEPPAERAAPAAANGRATPATANPRGNAAGANGKPAPASAKAPVISGDRGSASPVQPTVVPPQPAGTPQVPAQRAPSTAGAERTAIVIKRTAKVVKHPSVDKAATYRSTNAQNEDGDADDTPETNVDAEDAASDVRVVLQPTWVGGENGGKSQ